MYLTNTFGSYMFCVYDVFSKDSIFREKQNKRAKIKTSNVQMSWASLSQVASEGLRKTRSCQTNDFQPIKSFRYLALLLAISNTRIGTYQDTGIPGYQYRKPNWLEFPQINKTMQQKTCKAIYIWCIGWFKNCFTSWQHLRSYQDEYLFVTVMAT